ncbi:MAG: TetR/AcrR family transcriptional regulator [Rhodocyclaceae bacterium]|nr:TetR/AcrR family transcriptional regulator [Rhodocyclaceae bacterium]
MRSLSITTLRRPSERRLAVEAAVLDFARRHPDWGQARVAEAVGSEIGLKVSAAGVRWIWQRHQLETAAKRAAALRAHAGEQPLDPPQREALARIEARRGGAAGGEMPVLARQHLLSVAAREFSRKGYARTSIRGIANAAGMQPASVYYHFGSKEDLFVAAHTAGMQEVSVSIEKAVAACTDPWERLEAACIVHIRHLISGNDLTVWTGASLFLFTSPDIQRQLRTERDRFEAIYRRLIAALPLAPDLDRSLLRLQLLGALNWTRTWYRPGKRSPEQIARHLMRLLRKGAHACVPDRV